MSDDPETQTEATPAADEKPGLKHKSLGLRILLADVDDIRQRDVEKLMKLMNGQTTTGSQVEYDGNLLRAALMCGDIWIKQMEPQLTKDQVGGFSPRKVRWFANQIDALYRQTRDIPPN